MTTPEEAAELEQMKKKILRKILTKDALERLGRVRVASPVVALQLESYLVQIQQSGQLQEQIGDNQLKQILAVLTEKRKTKIKRK